MNENLQPVAAVCGNEVRIYGPVETTRQGKDFRPLRDAIEFPHHGAAVLYAQEHDSVSAKQPAPRR